MASKKPIADNEFARRVDARMKELGLSMNQLAKKPGLSYGSVNRILYDNETNIGRNTIAKVFDALGLNNHKDEELEKRVQNLSEEERRLVSGFIDLIKTTQNQ